MISNLKPYPATKDSRVQWLGAVPEHWKIYRAKWLFLKKSRPVRNSDEVVTCFRDGTVTKRKNRRAVGFTESLKEIGYQGIRRGDLVIHTMDAFAGAIGVADSDGKSTPMYSVCRPRSLVDSWYYAHIVREMARNQWILALAKGIRERSTDFRFADFSSQLVPLPPLPEQTAIVRFLDHATGRIERQIHAKEKLIALLEEQKQVVVNDAVTGRIDVRTGQPYPEYKDSGVEWVGEVPGHWEVLALKWVADRYQNGMTPPTSDSRYYEGGTIPWYGPSSCGDLEEVGKPIGYLNPIAFSDGKAKLIRGPALLIVVIGSLGRMALMFEDGATNQQITAFEICSSRVNPLFILQQLRFCESRLGATASAATIPILDSSVLKRLPCAMPRLVEQHAIVRYLEEATAPLKMAVQNTRRQIELLREYRTRLVADVVTGKLDVREAAADLPETAAPVGSGDLDAVFSDFEARDVGLRRYDNLTRDELYDEAINGDSTGVR